MVRETKLPMAIAENLCSGIVERLLGKQYCDWFEFAEIPEGEDYYILSSYHGHIKIQGNNGVSMAYGLKKYLMHFCHVYIGQQTIQNRMPRNVILPDKPIYGKAYSRIRYAYNYCTLSYSMPFWDEKRWQRELDWLALNGINLVLDFTGIEEVWYQFLTELGYSDEEIRNWIVSPCYTAWQQMQNIESFSGPVPRRFFTDRAALAVKNQAFMYGMGMIPIRQGYSGMVPSWHSRHDKTVNIFSQGSWNGITRPAMLDVSTDAYRQYAEMFYCIQDKVLGARSHYYAADVFHEGGIRPDSLTDSRISEAILSSMIRHDKDAVWVLQAWRENPTEELLMGIKKAGKQHALILDLSSTDNPGWEKMDSLGIPWVYCMLDMYGGRVSTHGEPDVLAESIPKDRQKSNCMEGIGLTSEATMHNPIIFDLLFDMAWEKDTVILEEWLKNWLTARYGKFEEKAFLAWKGLLQTAYHNPGYSHHGGYTQIFTFRPSLQMAYGNVFNELNTTIIKRPYYDVKMFQEAVLLLGQTWETLSGEESWCYDMQDLLRQVLNNQACSIVLEANEAWKRKDADLVSKLAGQFFVLFDACERLMSIRSDTTLGNWLGYARKAGEPYGEETEKLFVRDAKMLITTWGNREAYRYLADYAYRQYAGLMNQYYRPRWEIYFKTGKDYSCDEWYDMALKFLDSYDDEKILCRPAASTIFEVLELLTQ